MLFPEEEKVPGDAGNRLWLLQGCVHVDRDKRQRAYEWHSPAKEYINNFYSQENINNLYLEYKNLIDKKITNIKYLLDLFGNYAPSDVYENVYNTLYPLVNAKTYEEYNLCKISTKNNKVR